MTKNKKLTRVKFSLFIGAVVTLLPLITGSCGHTVTCQNAEILRAESLIWTYPDSTKSILEGMDTCSLSEKDRMYRDLFYTHACLRLTRQPVSDTLLAQISDYFVKNGPKRYACGALYVRGSNFFCRKQYTEATRYLKEAEQHLSYLPADSYLPGMIYYLLAYAAESEYLYPVAYDYQQKALPYFRNLNDHLHLGACYCDIARTLSMSGHRANDYSCYFDSALYEAETIGYKEMVYDIQIQRELLQDTPDSVKLIELCQYYHDSIGNHHYIALLTDWAILKEDWQQVEDYLNEIQRNKGTSIEWDYQYTSLLAQYKAHKGDFRSAYNDLLEAYIAKHRNYISLSENRTYAIARRYDLEREQEKTLRLTIQRQRLWITIAVIALILIIIVCSATWVIMQQKHKEERLRHERAEAATREEAQKEHIRHLQDELTERQQHLQKRFMERVQFLCTLKKEKEIYHRDLPKWLNEVLDAKRLTNKDEWKHFERDFNDTYNDIMDEIRNKHPRLTDEDCRYLMLHMTGLDNESIGVLLQLEPRTLWNRKQKVKNRLGTEDLDRWIKENLLQFEKRG